MIPSERIGHTSTYTTQVLRKADAQLHPECQKIWDPEILAGKVHRRQKLGCVKEKKREKSFKEKGLTIFKKVFGLAVALVGKSRALGFQRPRLNFSLLTRKKKTASIEQFKNQNYSIDSG